MNQKSAVAALLLSFSFAAPLAAEETRAESTGFDLTVPRRCPGTGISEERNLCLSDVLRRVEERRTVYLAAALRRYQYQKELVERIAASDAAFVAYRRAECAAASAWWQQDEDKSLAVFAEHNCAIALTDQRTRQIWEKFLHFVDDVPPILPEPEPYPAERIERALW